MTLIGPVFGIVSAVLIVASGPSYVLSTIEGETKPHRVTWFIWAILGVTALVSQIALGASWSLLFSGVDALGSLAMFVLALKFGVGGWSPLERMSLMVAAIGIGVSLEVQQPIVALIGVIVADAAGYALTVRKAYEHPESETKLTWLLIAASAACGMIAVGRWQIDLLLFPLYLALASLCVVAAQTAGQSRRAFRK
jgi:hypothetical protein